MGHDLAMTHKVPALISSFIKQTPPNFVTFLKIYLATIWCNSSLFMLLVFYITFRNVDFSYFNEKIKFVALICTFLPYLSLSL